MVLWFLLAVSVIYFTWRGPMRAAAAGGSGDLTVGYSAAIAWAAGENPYDPRVLAEKLHAADAGELAEPTRMDFMRNIYFPVALPMYMPLTMLNWSGAKWAWILLNLVGVAAIGAGLLYLAGMRVSELRAGAFLVLLIALAPVHSTMAMGQTGIIATALVVMAAALERQRSPVAAGIFYGLAIALKMQIALPFLAYVIWKRRWPTAAAGVLVIVAFSALSIGRMELAGVRWYGTWMANLVGTTSGGGHNDASLANPGRHSMLCLPVLLYGFIDNRMAVMAITYTLVLAAAAFAVYFLRGRYPKQELLALSIVAVLSLLVTYHRTYDAVLLAIPLAWAFAADRQARPLALAVVLCGLVFVVPGQTMLHEWVVAGRISSVTAGTTFWVSGIAVHQVWLVVLCCVLLLIAAWRVAKEQRSALAADTSN